MNGKDSHLLCCDIKNSEDQVEDDSQGQTNFIALRGETEYSEGDIEGDFQGRVKGMTLNIGQRPRRGRDADQVTENFEDDLQDDFEGHPKDISLRIALSTVSSLLADDRLPQRYLDSLMQRLRQGHCDPDQRSSRGHDPDQAALVFDGYALSWSWTLNSVESFSSSWISSTDSLLDSESLPTDDWSMQPATASDLPAVDPSTAADWLIPPPAIRNWSSADSPRPTLDVDYSPRKCALLPALRRPLSNLLQTTTDVSESPQNPADRQSSGDYAELHGVVFCECGGQSCQRSETIDFFIDDGATETLV